jgi:AcrR family transcriptional regulator
MARKHMAATPLRSRRTRSSRPTQVERSEDARARIIEAAFACLAEQGYQQTTLAEIAKRAGCSRELPRYHFGTKDRLMEVLLDETGVAWTGLFKRQLETNVTGPDALRNIADVFADRFTQDSARFRGFAVLLFGAADPSLHALHKKIVVTQRVTRAAFKEIVVEHLKHQPGQPMHDVDGMAALIYAIFRGFTYQWLIDPESISIEAMFREFKRLCPQLLGDNA